MAENAGVFLVPTMQAIREDRAGLAKGTLADYTAAKFPRDAEQIEHSHRYRRQAPRPQAHRRPRTWPGRPQRSSPRNLGTPCMMPPVGHRSSAQLIVALARLGVACAPLET